MDVAEVLGLRAAEEEEFKIERVMPSPSSHDQEEAILQMNWWTTPSSPSRTRSGGASPWCIEEKTAATARSDALYTNRRAPGHGRLSGKPQPSGCACSLKPKEKSMYSSRIHALSIMKNER